MPRCPLSARRRALGATARPVAARPFASSAATASTALVFTALALGATARPARAQGVLDATVRVAPDVVVYRTGSGDARTTTRETLFPVAAVVPLYERLTLDVATAYVTAEARAEGATVSRISGLTDTQLRASYTLGTDAVVLTAGLNLPTGRYAVPTGELEAAGRIGNDFLGFPVSSMGDGLATTAGIVGARTLGLWNAGIAASMRHATAFDAFAIPDGTVRFRPADEYRVRVGADRFVGAGRLSLGLTYATFGSDVAGPTAYGTGDRTIVQAGYSRPIAGAELRVDGWNLYHGIGQTAGGAAPAENVASLALAMRWHAGPAAVEPSLEWRDWRRDGSAAGRLALLGLAASVPTPWAGASVVPSVGFAHGRILNPADPAVGGVDGWRAGIGLRWSRQ